MLESVSLLVHLSGILLFIKYTFKDLKWLHNKYTCNTIKHTYYSQGIKSATKSWANLNLNPSFKSRLDDFGEASNSKLALKA